MAEETTEEGTPGLDSLIWQIANRRWREEKTGVVYNNHRFRGDTGGRQSIIEAIKAAEVYESTNGDGSWSTSWKTQDGWLTVTLADLYEVLDLLGARRQQCFAIEKEKIADAEAGNPVDLGSGWPA